MADTNTAVNTNTNTTANAVQGRKTCQQRYIETFEGDYTRKFFKKVPAKYVLLRRNTITGKIKEKKGFFKGIKFTLPWNKTRLVYVGEQNIDYEPFQVRTKEGFDVGLDLAIRFQVVNAELACHENKNIFEFVRNSIQDVLNTLIIKIKYDELVPMEFTDLAAEKERFKNVMIQNTKVTLRQEAREQGLEGRDITDYVNANITERANRNYRESVVPVQAGLNALQNLFRMLETNYGVKVGIASKQRIIQSESMKEAFAAKVKAEKEKQAKFVQVEATVKQISEEQKAKNDALESLFDKLFIKYLDKGVAPDIAAEAVASIINHRTAAESGRVDYLNIMNDGANNVGTNAGIARQLGRTNH